MTCKLQQKLAISNFLANQVHLFHAFPKLFYLTSCVLNFYHLVSYICVLGDALFLVSPCVHFADDEVCTQDSVAPQFIHMIINCWIELLPYMSSACCEFKTYSRDGVLATRSRAEALLAHGIFCTIIDLLAYILD